jgi:hypothetical protein
MLPPGWSEVQGMRILAHKRGVLEGRPERPGRLDLFRIEIMLIT